MSKKHTMSTESNLGVALAVFVILFLLMCACLCGIIFLAYKITEGDPLQVMGVIDEGLGNTKKGQRVKKMYKKFSSSDSNSGHTEANVDDFWDSD